MAQIKSVIMLIFLALIFSRGYGVQIERIMTLDEGFLVKWTVDFDSESIFFELIVNTTGYVGFGLSPEGGMKGSDIVIGGIKDGVPYFSDRYGTGNLLPKIDDSQDWKLLAASENCSHTALNFTRALDTCDDEDIPINNDTIKFIWAVGATDEIRDHARKGVARVNILATGPPRDDVSKYNVWHLTVSTAIPRINTVYWCTMHKSPPYPSKRHIVGFSTKLNNKESIRHNHHLILHHCTGTTAELRKFYESFVGKTGAHCYSDNNVLELMQTCEQYLYTWGMGGTPFFLPKNVGIPLNEFGEQEYFLLEIHYDNPELEQLQYETGLEIYITNEIRDHDAGTMTLGHDVRFTLTIPPSTPNFTIVGHCGSSCTAAKVPADGIHIFSILLHSHMAGRKLKLRQFRDGIELPWVANDDRFDFSFQQNRGLPVIRQVLPGDHLSYECEDDSTYRNPAGAVIGGLSTHNEMCQSFVMYYPRIADLYVCGSYFDDLDALDLLGLSSRVYNYLDPTITAPPIYAGKEYSKVVDLITWDANLKKRWQNFSRFSNHTGICGGIFQKYGAQSIQSTGFRVGYPQFSSYLPPAYCKSVNNTVPSFGIQQSE